MGRRLLALAYRVSAPAGAGAGRRKPAAAMPLSCASGVGSCWRSYGRIVPLADGSGTVRPHLNFVLLRCNHVYTLCALEKTEYCVSEGESQLAARIGLRFPLNPNFRTGCPPKCRHFLVRTCGVGIRVFLLPSLLSWFDGVASRG